MKKQITGIQYTKGKENPRNIDRIGEQGYNKQGCLMTIIAYRGCSDIDVQFENSYISKNKEYGNFKKGQIKNFYHPSVYGIGYEGIGKYSQKDYLLLYNIWTNMIKRCYSKKQQELQPTYKDCIVTEEWYNFQNYAKWYEDNKIENFEVDKDILKKGNKIYSSETCCFVPTEINNLFVKNDIRRGELPIGVFKNGNGFTAVCRINGKQVSVGTKKTSKEAFYLYKYAKEQEIKKVAEKYKHQITEQTYQALINYNVEITD